MFDDDHLKLRSPRFAPFDEVYPNVLRKKHFPGMIEEAEVLRTNVSGEVELIARSSYRLGHAERGIANVLDENERLRDRRAELSSSLNTARRDRDTYKEKFEGADKWGDEKAAELEIALAKIARLEKRLNPNKKVAKKGKK